MTDSHLEINNTSLKSHKLHNSSYAPTSLPAAGILPKRGQLPPGSHMPLGAAQIFIGREENLKALAAILLPSNMASWDSMPGHGAAIIHAGPGALDLGGTGKTQLAAEFCQRYGRYFQSVHWINAARGEIKVEIARNGAALELQSWSSKTSEQSRLTYTAWANGAPRLIVLDDPIYPGAVGPLLNSLPKNVRILVTSRQGGWQDKLGLVEHALDVMTPSEGRRLLHKMAPRLEKESDEALNRLGEGLGWLPLTLRLAGGCLNEHNDLPLQTYLDAQLQDDSTDLLASAFDLCWQQLAGKTNVTARRLLLACGWLAPNEPLPLDILSSAFGENTDMNLERLYRLGLLSRDHNSHFLIHPRLAELAQQQHTTDGDEALNAAATEMVRISHSLAQPADILPYRVHLETLATAAEHRELEIAKTLFSESGHYQSKFAEYERARNSLAKALTFIEKVSGLENSEYTECLNNLGSVLHNLENFEGAKKCFEQAILMDQKILGKDDPAVATGHNNLGQVLLDMNNPDGAILHLEKAVEINAKQLGPDHPYVASGYYNLGIVLHAIGDLPRAKSLLERVLAVRKKILGDSHPDVAQSHHSLGMALQTIGNLHDAKMHYEQAVSVWEAALGPDSLETAAAITSLAGMLHVTGDLSGAKAHYEQALRVFEAALPPENENIRDVQLQLELLKQGLTYPQLLQKMEAGEDLPDDLLDLLDDLFGDSD
jgi:tetratricopeptide (TPR) repeat protein